MESMTATGTDGRMPWQPPKLEAVHLLDEVHTGILVGSEIIVLLSTTS